MPHNAALDRAVGAAIFPTQSAAVVDSVEHSDNRALVAAYRPALATTFAAAIAPAVAAADVAALAAALQTTDCPALTAADAAAD